MNPALRRMGVIALVLLAALMVQSTWVAFFHHEDYEGLSNARTLIAEYEVPRGQILAGDTVIAESVPTDGGSYGYRRNYPEGDYFGNITGFKSINYGASNLEAYENSLLNGTSSLLAFDDFWATVLKENKTGGNVVTTIDADLQKAAYDAIADAGVQGGAVVIDPKTGRILAQASYPGWNPTDVSSNNGETAEEAKKALDDSGDMLDLTRQEYFPPGSTFKTLVAAAYIENGGKADDMVPAGNGYTAPDTNHEIKNSSAQCPDEEYTLEKAFELSCNTTFARMCVEDLTVDQITEITEAFGFGETYETPLSTAASGTGDLSEDAFRAQACIGQQDVVETVLQNAVVAATIANGGDRMAPQIIAELTDSEGNTVQNFAEDNLGRSIDLDTAQELQILMEAVVENGTGRTAQIDGYTVGGKTGTAQHSDSSDNPEPDHGWFHGYAMDKDGEPAVAVCVFLDSYGDGASAKAAEISGDLMEQVLEGGEE
ncbi:penicillin-binding transpeptidase domain-containing protein [Glycomyces algeriensis]|uniref:Penicillin-binding protein n=1 Tax=Glycomyces algeriensis TaxID=256037 RepID=A0A9W6LFE6_9ACTN|nr:penicillin-binding transpeptidase domain-containing protein [Glycomyces algeriensis]MDA1368171.1 penicillin-binding transpeptidase domain-containing protein [Glycomyces algeriensis]MDR7348845.1 peptidoglycan glycosyltransferase [Glycomyces algeriensis]GLI41548.1 penicillin-binding protein [Glycomyces algeriensis]